MHYGSWPLLSVSMQRATAGGPGVVRWEHFSPSDVLCKNPGVILRSSNLCRSLRRLTPHLNHLQHLRLLDFVAELQEPMTGADFGSNIVSLVGAMFPDSVVAVDQIHEASKTYLLDHNCPLDEANTTQYFARLQQVYRQNPIYQHIRAGGSGVVRLSDLGPRAMFERTDFYNDIFRPLGLRHQITVVMPRDGWITTLTLNRDRDFPQPVTDLLQLASRHIILSHRNAELLSQLPSNRILQLTPREREVARWMREGKRNGEIAIIVGCAVRTVEKHVENILYKTGAETRGAAVRKLGEA
jgi:DNA-binding CsgD family transcriptional regulator